MSCPNPELLCAYFDGEVESPWSDRIDQHIETCSSCRDALARLQSLKTVLQADETAPVREAQQRTRGRLERQLSRPQRSRSRFWRMRLSVPAPAVAALMVVFMGMGGLLVFLGTRPNFPFMSIKRQPSGVTEVQVAAPIEDLEQLLKSLDQEPGNQQLIITLPEDTEFLQLGEPRMLRAEEYFRRVR